MKEKTPKREKVEFPEIVWDEQIIRKIWLRLYPNDPLPERKIENEK